MSQDDAELEELRALHAEGVLTDDEFDAARARAGIAGAADQQAGPSQPEPGESRYAPEASRPVVAELVDGPAESPAQQAAPSERVFAAAAQTPPVADTSALSAPIGGPLPIATTAPHVPGTSLGQIMGIVSGSAVAPIPGSPDALESMHQGAVTAMQRSAATRSATLVVGVALQHLVLPGDRLMIVATGTAASG